MFANLLELITHRPSSGFERGFVEEVRLRRPRAPNPRIRRLFLICWAVILIKCAFVAWAVPRYHIPFSSLWVILPTLAFAALVTAVYWARRRF